MSAWLKHILYDNVCFHALCPLYSVVVSVSDCVLRTLRAKKLRLLVIVNNLYTLL